MYVLERYLLGSAYDFGNIGQNAITSVWGGSLSAISIGNREFGFGNYYKRESGFRFSSLYIPSDAVITSAYVLFKGFVSETETYVNSRVYVQDSISAEPLIAGTEAEMYADYIARSRLTPIDWDGLTGWDGLTQHQTPDLKTQIQYLIDTYGVIDNGIILVFWGDVDGRTSRPSLPYVNCIDGPNTPGMVRLRIEFESSTGIPTPKPSIFYQAKHLNDAVYNLAEENIINDFRILIPRYGSRPDFTVDPPVMIPFDYVQLKADAISQAKYGRRTKINKYSLGNFPYHGDELCERVIKDSKDPVPTLEMATVPQTDGEVLQALSSSLSDKFLVDITSMGLSKRYWIDSKVMRLDAAHIEVEYGLTEITALTNIPGVFNVGIDVLNDTEELIA